MLRVPSTQYIQDNLKYRREKDTWNFLGLLEFQELNRGYILSEVSIILLKGSAFFLCLYYHVMEVVECRAAMLFCGNSGMILLCITYKGVKDAVWKTQLPGTWLCESGVCTPMQRRVSIGPMAQLLVWFAQLFSPFSSSFIFPHLK